MVGRQPLRAVSAGRFPTEAVRRLSLTALIVAIAMLALSLGVAVNEHNHHHAAAERPWMADHHARLDAGRLDGPRADDHPGRGPQRGLPRLLHPARQPHVELRPGSTYVDGANDALVYLESLFPTQIGELCFIDRSGSENARVVHGQRAPVSDLSPDEASNPFFGSTFALRPGQVFQSRPYVSPDTHDWVIGTPHRSPGRPAPLGGDRPLRAVRRELPAPAARRRRSERDVPRRRADRRRGHRQLPPAEDQRALQRPGDRRFAALARRPGLKGVTKVDGHVRPTGIWPTMTAMPRSTRSSSPPHPTPHPEPLGDIGTAPLAVARPWT